MGRDLTGKELGVGIVQRKDGLYTARFTDNHGVRRQKYFRKLHECRKWIEEEKFNFNNGLVSAFEEMTVSEWFYYWIENIKGATAKHNTIESYNSRFKQNIEPCIGKILLKDIKPLHCQRVLNQMRFEYKTATVNLTRVTMKMLFEDAVENELIIRNPVTKSVKCIEDNNQKPKKALTFKEQKMFIEEIKRYDYYYQYAFILQTGLRVGELTGLKWSDIDFDNKKIHISRTLNYCRGEWVESTTKSKSGIRDIPLTNDAITILRNLQKKRQKLNIISMQYYDFVFLSRKGTPIPRAAYYRNLRTICKRLKISHISMHSLRHTFATRCVEAGMQPKILQVIMGHSSINVTMNIYVHIMEETKTREVKKIESMLKVI